MGIPNYGHDWPLPFVRGVTEAANIGNHEAIEIAALNNAAIQYDDISQAPFSEYTRDGVGHIVWFEDVRSILAKLNLVTEYGFRGVDYWQLMRPFRQNWLLAVSYTHLDVYKRQLLCISVNVQDVKAQSHTTHHGQPVPCLYGKIPLQR